MVLLDALRRPALDVIAPLHWPLDAVLEEIGPPLGDQLLAAAFVNPAGHHGRPGRVDVLHCPALADVGLAKVRGAMTLDRTRPLPPRNRRAILDPAAPPSCLCHARDSGAVGEWDYRRCARSDPRLRHSPVEISPIHPQGDERRGGHRGNQRQSTSDGCPIWQEPQRGRVRQGGVISAVAVGHRQAALAVMCRG